MTIHAAKGLEFDTVFLAGWEEGVFPSQRALDEGGNASLEEERRLAYVAITRARRRCIILHAANRRIYGQWTSSHPVRFVAELPEAHVDSETTMTRRRIAVARQLVRTRRPLRRRRPRHRPRPRLAARRDAAAASTAPRARVIEARASAVSLGNPGRGDIAHRPARLPLQVRLRRGGRDRGQQAGDRLREGRAEAGAGQLRQPGVMKHNFTLRRENSDLRAIESRVLRQQDFTLSEQQRQP